MYSRHRVPSNEYPTRATDSYLPTTHPTLSIMVDMPVLIPLDSTYGVMLVGSMFAIWLFGTSIVQLYVYFSHFPEDALHIKVLVSVLMALDVAQAVFLGHLMYTLLVTNWGDVSSLDNVPWSLHAEIISNALVVCIVQCFFIRRIWVLSEYKRWMVGILSAIAFMTLGIAMFFGIKDVGHQVFSGFHAYTPIVITWSVSDMVLDGAIAGLLLYYLQKSRTSLKGSNNIINILVIYTVNTGAITCSASTAHLVLFLASPNTGVHFAFHFVLAKLYTNSLYASLNSRAGFRRTGESNRSVYGMTSRGTTHAARSMVDPPSVAGDGTSIPRLYIQRPIETTNIPETVSPPSIARYVEKLGIRPNPHFGYLQDDSKYEPHGWDTLSRRNYAVNL